MKRIFILGATLLAAGGAYGFAKVADHLTEVPEATVPSAAFAVERIDPIQSSRKPITAMRTAPAITNLPQTSMTTTGLQTIAKPDVATFAATEMLPASVNIGAMQPTEFNALLPTTETFGTNNMPVTSLEPWVAEQHGRFETLPLIGVYR